MRIHPVGEGFLLDSLIFACMGKEGGGMRETEDRERGGQGREGREREGRQEREGGQGDGRDREKEER